MLTALVAGGVNVIARQQAAAADANALEVIELRPNFYVIAGDGSNIAVQLGTDGIVIVDTGTGTKAKQVIAEIRTLSSKPIRYVINTSADAYVTVGHAPIGNADFSPSGAAIRDCTFSSAKIGARPPAAPISLRPPVGMTDCPAADSSSLPPT